MNEEFAFVPVPHVRARARIIKITRTLSNLR